MGRSACCWPPPDGRGRRARARCASAAGGRARRPAWTVAGGGVLVAAWRCLPAEVVVLARASLALAWRAWRRARGARAGGHRGEALTDDVTGLPNRRALFPELELLTARRGAARRAALLLLDLDGFKELNDTLGHARGDDAAGRGRPRAWGRRAGTLARLGGDEFAALVPRATTPRAVADAIGARCPRRSSSTASAVSVDASVGIARFPHDAHDPRELARRADVAMYDAKRQARPRRRLRPVERDGLSRERLALAADLRAALATATGCGSRSSRRSTSPRAGPRPRRWCAGGTRRAATCSPDELLPIAERTWPDAGADRLGAGPRGRPGRDAGAAPAALRITVNVSARAESTRRCPTASPRRSPATRAVRPPRHRGHRGRRHGRPAAASRSSTRIAALGVRIAIDDFGTGHSSLAQLKHLPADELKIDRRFVRGMARDALDAEIVALVVGLGRRMGVRVVAEGVETAEERAAAGRDRLRSRPGLRRGRPMPAAQFERWAKEPSDRARLLVPQLHTSASPRRRRRVAERLERRGAAYQSTVRRSPSSRSTRGAQPVTRRSFACRRTDGRSRRASCCGRMSAHVGAGDPADQLDDLAHRVRLAAAGVEGLAAARRRSSSASAIAR